MVLGLASPEHCYAAIPQLELHAAQTYDASCCPQDGSPVYPGAAEHLLCGGAFTEA